MIIYLSKFGHLLSSRELGREAWQAFFSSVGPQGIREPVTLDFDGVSTLSHSWADEFLSSLLAQIQGSVTLQNTANASVRATLEFLVETYGERLRFAPPRP